MGGPATSAESSGEAARDFAAIFATYHAPILRYLTALVRDSALAEDLAQETFEKAYQALGRAAPDNLNAWLYAIATNLALGVFRRRRILTFLSLGALGTQEPEAVEADLGQAAGDRELVAQVLGRLPKHEAACLLLYFQQGLSYLELAVVLGVSVPAAKMRLSRARSAFREVYLSLYEEPSP